MTNNVVHFVTLPLYTYIIALLVTSSTEICSLRGILSSLNTDFKLHSNKFISSDQFLMCLINRTISIAHAAVRTQHNFPVAQFCKQFV